MIACVLVDVNVCDDEAVDGTVVECVFDAKGHCVVVCNDADDCVGEPLDDPENAKRSI